MRACRLHPPETPTFRRSAPRNLNGIGPAPLILSHTRLGLEKQRVGAKVRISCACSALPSFSGQRQIILPQPSLVPVSCTDCKHETPLQHSTSMALARCLAQAIRLYKDAAFPPPMPHTFSIRIFHKRPSTFLRPTKARRRVSASPPPSRRENV